MTKKRHNSEIRVYLYGITDEECIDLRDKIKDLIFNTKDLSGNRIRSAVTSFAKRSE